MRNILNYIRGTLGHPQWLSDRFQTLSKRKFLSDITHSFILDIGSGNSRYDRILKGGNTLVRLDYPETNRHYEVLPDVYGDACRLPFLPAKFDAVFLFEVLEHIKEYDLALREVFRVLKAGGVLYISVPFIYPIHDAPNDFRRFTIYGLRHELAKHGFEIVEETQHGNSLITALQILNLSFLEFVRFLYRKIKLVGYLAGLMIYPLCLLINILSLPLLCLPNTTASCFGYFVIARRHQKAL